MGRFKRRRRTPQQKEYRIYRRTLPYAYRDARMFILENPEIRQWPENLMIPQNLDWTGFYKITG